MGQGSRRSHVVYRAVKCVIAISEGRDERAITAVEAALDEPGVAVLSSNAYPIHGRTIFTLVGPGDAVRKAAWRCVQKATDRIHLGKRSGTYPCIGATDSISIEPVGETSPETCATIANRIGVLAGDRLDIPVFLNHDSIASLRASGFDGLERNGLPAPPDFGPARPHPTAGVLPVRARAVTLAVERSGQLSFESMLASAFPVPGGGAVAARVGHLAACLVHKVIRISLRSKASASIREDLARSDEATTALSKRFVALEDADQRAFFALLEAMRLPRKIPGDTETRRATLRSAARGALGPPVDTLETAVDLVGILDTLAGHARHGHIRAQSDLGAAVELVGAVFRSAEWNVRANLPLADDSVGASVRARQEALRTQFESAIEKVTAALSDTGGVERS